jgi:hypothetical protein
MPFMMPAETARELQVSEKQLRALSTAGQTLRQQDKNRGIRKPKSALSNSRFKKKIDGTVIDRRTGEIVS